MRDVIRFARGESARLPILDLAEPAFTTDTKKVYIGTGTGNIELAQQKDVDVITTQLTEKAEQLEQRQQYVNVKIFGAVGNYNPTANTGNNDTLAFKAAVAFAETVKRKLYIPSGLYKITDTLLITSRIAIFGDGEKESLLYGMFDGSLIKIKPSSEITRLSFEKFGMMGTKNATDKSIGIEFDTSISSAIVDSKFSDLLLQNFDLGLSTKFAWSNSFENVRFQNCSRPSRFGSQTNATLFNRCAFVTFTNQLQFTNTEGIQFNSCEIANYEGTGSAINLFQSELTMLNTYFEYINSNAIATVGAVSEMMSSGLSIIGGMCSGKITNNSSASEIKVSNVRLHIGDSITLDSPLFNFLTKKQFALSYHASGQVPDAIKKSEWHGNKPLPFNASWGGHTAVSTVRKKRYSEVEATQGILIANDLVVGKQYTLVLSIRKKTTSTVTLRHDYVLDITNEVSSSAEEFTVKYLPFIARNTALRMEWTGILDVAYICLTEGLYQDVVTKNEEIPLFANSMPNSGTWGLGDRVYNTAPTSNSVDGWVCTVSGNPGIWKSFGTIQA